MPANYVGQPGGAGPYPLVGLPAAAPPVLPLQLLASTGPAGFALQNATPSILSGTVPSDGQTHRILLFLSLTVSSAETGGELALSFTDPGGASTVWEVLAGSLAAGVWTAASTAPVIQSGSTVTLEQFSALTVGAATLWAEIWGS